MLGKKNFLTYLLLSIFILNLVTLVINVEDWTLDIIKLNDEEKVGYHPSLAVTREENKLESSVIDELGEGQSVAGSLSNDPGSKGQRSKTQSEYTTPNWVDTRWNYRKNLTIDNTKVDADLDNFPVLIDLLDSDLRNEAQATGGDIFFTDDSGNKLNHEIEVYDRVYNSTHSHLVAWVQTNLSNSLDTTLSMYYGNPTAFNQQNKIGVWDDNYEFVLHMNQDPASSDILDSTGNSFDFDVEPAGSMTSDDLVDGKTGKALALDGVDDYIYLPLAEGFSGPTDKMTFEFWIMFPNGGPTSRDYLAAPATSALDPYLSFYNEFEFHIETDGGYIMSSAQSSFTAGTWYNIVAMWDGTGAGLFEVYIGGSFDNDEPPRLGTHVSWNTLSIGAEDDDADGPGGSSSADELHATISEFRLSNVVRSPEWVSTNYANQNNPASFYSVGTKESSPVTDDWAQPLFKYRKNITIDASQVSGSGNLIDFPILINLSDTDLHDTSKVQTDGDDILFTDAFGTKLDHEIELFDQTGNGTHANLLAWIKIPSLSGTIDTNITMYYGNNAVNSQENPEGVWLSDYGAIWHLTDDFLDSTVNNNDGTNSGSTDIQGIIADGQSFEGPSDHVNVGSGTSIDNVFNGGATISTWIYLYGWGGGNYGRILDKSTATDGSNGWGMCVDNVNPISKHLLFYRDFSAERGLWYTPADSLSLDQWYYLVVSFDDSNEDNVPTVYINGVSQSLVADSSSDAEGTAVDDSAQSLYIGKYSGSNTRTFDGIIDEVRISYTFRSSNWINTEYDNQLNPESFHTTGSEEEYRKWWADASFSSKKDIVIDENKVSGTWAYQKSITIDSSKVPGDLSDFPVLINIYDSDLYDVSKVQTDGDDIAFLDTNGIQLDHEIELFDQDYNSSHAHLVAWVRIPNLLGTSDTSFTMHYGNNTLTNQENATGVWNSNFKGIWHLSEDPTGTIYDSTSNDNDGTAYGGLTATDQVSGQIDGSINFLSSTQDYINVGDRASLDMGSGDFSMSIWFNSDGTNNGPLVGKGAYGSGGLRYYIALDNGYIKGEIDDNAIKNDLFSLNTVGDSIWHYAVLVRDGNYLRFYLDGTGTTTDPDEDISSTGSLDMAKPFYMNTLDSGGLSDWANAILDEVRVSNTARSANWITTEYNNQKNPTTFFSVGNEENTFLTDFPVLIDITSSDFKSDKVQPNGYDILFTDINGIKLDHEIEIFTQDGNSGRIIAWVGVPKLFQAEDTVISMYYGN
ncbi:MAG: DUF2341 domain-containing protein, partial [Candidatus Hodarchaeales archaeon]